MYRLAIVGAGQLGSRHLQALARLGLACEIDVIDPSRSSLDLARQRFDEMPANSAVRDVRYHPTMEALPPNVDYAIVATTADVRLNAIRSLLETSKVRALLLEKVLFQRLDEYRIAHELLRSYGVRTWVNCINRVFPIYRDVQAFFAGEPLCYFQARGGEWGLGCNSIHYLDLLGMLTDALPEAISTLALDGKLTPSKRQNYREFTGILRGRYSNGADFELASVAGSCAPLQLTFRSQSRTCVIDEGSGAVAFFDSKSGGAWECREFKVPFLSELASVVADQILTHGACSLPTFEQSMAYHLPLLKALGSYAAAVEKTSPDSCPIT